MTIPKMERRAHAEQLAHLIPRERLHPVARAVIDASVVKGDRWLVGLSGGADSVALLLLLWAHWPERRGLLRAAHFNHRLRGVESDADEMFCRSLCKEIGVAFVSQAWADSPPSSSEDQARKARYSFFGCVAESQNCTLLLMGHQQDDIAETQLMRLARGASSAGLAAPRPARPWGKARFLVRPLLSLPRSELQAALRSASISWREDSSNETDVYFRNRIRRSVVPLWLQAAGSGALDGAALTREWMEEDDQALELVLDRLGIPAQTDELNLRLLRDQPRALWRRALHRWQPLGQISRRAFDELLTACQRGEGQLSLGLGFAKIGDGWLKLLPAVDAPLEPWTPSGLSIGSVLVLPNGKELMARRLIIEDALRGRFQRGTIDNSIEVIVQLPREEFVVRSWRPGDRYQPLGAPGSSKLQDLFVNKKVPPTLRHQLPVICTPTGDIVWVPGFPPAASSKVTDECVTAVQLTYTSGTYTVQK